MKDFLIRFIIGNIELAVWYSVLYLIGLYIFKPFVLYMRQLNNTDLLYLLTVVFAIVVLIFVIVYCCLGLYVYRTIIDKLIDMKIIEDDTTAVF